MLCFSLFVSWLKSSNSVAIWTRILSWKYSLSLSRLRQRQANRQLVELKLSFTIYKGIFRKCRSINVLIPPFLLIGWMDVKKDEKVSFKALSSPSHRHLVVNCCHVFPSKAKITRTNERRNEHIKRRSKKFAAAEHEKSLEKNYRWRLSPTRHDRI